VAFLSEEKLLTGNEENVNKLKNYPVDENVLIA